MRPVKAIRSEADYEATLARIEALMGARSGSPEGQELDVLVDLVEHYESKHVPLGYPTVASAIAFRLEQLGLSRNDLVAIFGSRQRASQVLAGKRPLTMKTAQVLHTRLGVPADVLLRSLRPKTRRGSRRATVAPGRSRRAS